MMHLVQGLRQRLAQTEVALREAQAKRDAEAAACAAMSERLQAGEDLSFVISFDVDALQNKLSPQSLRRSCGN